MSEYGKSEQVSWPGGPKTTNIYAFGKEQPGINTPDQFREEGARPYAEVNLGHSYEAPNYEYTYTGKIPDKGTIDSDSPNEMFTHHPSTINGLYSDPSMTHHVGNLLGAAINEHRRREGSSTSMPLPSDDLSAHSSKLINRARSKGVKVPINPENKGSEPTNDISMNSQFMSRDTQGEMGIKPMSDSERQAGKATFREIMRGPKPSNVSPQQFDEHFTQGRLF